MDQSWREWPVTRIAGSFLGWALFVACFGSLFQVVLAVMALGGSCASGGPYVIAVECPDNVWLAPVSIWVGLGSVGLWMFLARGFAAPLVSWAWPVLFVGLGGAFLAAFVVGGDIVGLLIGVMFVAMGLVPFVIELRASPRRVFLGQFAADGRQFAEGDRARQGLMMRARPNPEGAIEPTAVHWLLGIGVPLAGVAAGVSLASILT